MAQLRTLWVLHTTSRASDANTDEGFNLHIRSQINPGVELAKIRFPNLPHDERERGRTDEYSFDLEGLDINMFGLNEDNFCIEILGDDAWLPESIWIIGEDVTGVRQLLLGIPHWPPDKWWSTDSSEGKRQRCLDEPFRLFAEE